MQPKSHNSEMQSRLNLSRPVHYPRQTQYRLNVPWLFRAHPSVIGLGQGHPEGIIAAESANNAEVGPSLVRIAVSGAFIGVIYLLFAVLLRVQTPTGIFF